MGIVSFAVYLYFALGIAAWLLGSQRVFNKLYLKISKENSRFGMLTPGLLVVLPNFIERMVHLPRGWFWCATVAVSILYAWVLNRVTLARLGERIALSRVIGIVCFFFFNVYAVILVIAVQVGILVRLGHWLAR